MLIYKFIKINNNINDYIYNVIIRPDSIITDI